MRKNNFLQKGAVSFIGVLAVFALVAALAGTVYFVKTQSANTQSQASTGNTKTYTGTVMGSDGNLYFLKGTNNSNLPDVWLMGGNNINIKQFVGKKVSLKGTIINSVNVKQGQAVVLVLSISPAP